MVLAMSVACPWLRDDRVDAALEKAMRWLSSKRVGAMGPRACFEIIVVVLDVQHSRSRVRSRPPSTLMVKIALQQG